MHWQQIKITIRHCSRQQMRISPLILAITLLLLVRCDTTTPEAAIASALKQAAVSTAAAAAGQRQLNVRAESVAASGYGGVAIERGTSQLLAWGLFDDVALREPLRVEFGSHGVNVRV